jgi:hypothetical protein
VTTVTIDRAVSTVTANKQTDGQLGKPVENPTQKIGKFAKKGNGERGKVGKEDLRIFYENLISNLCLGRGCETGFKNCQKTT